MALDAVCTILSFLSLLRVRLVYVLLTGPSASVSCNSFLINLPADLLLTESRCSFCASIRCSALPDELLSCFWRAWVRVGPTATFFDFGLLRSDRTMFTLYLITRSRALIVAFNLCNCMSSSRNNACYKPAAGTVRANNRSSSSP